MIMVLHDVVFEDNHLPKNIKEANKLIRSISCNYDMTQCFELIELDDVTHKRVSRRWVECDPEGSIRVYHKEVFNDKV